MSSSYKTCKLKQWPAHKTYWNNGGTDVMEVTKYFVIISKAHAMRQIEPIPETSEGAKNPSLDRPQGKNLLLLFY